MDANESVYHPQDWPELRCVTALAVRELAGPTIISLPSRWTIGKENPVQELDRIAKILVTGTEALAGLYMRMCDLIRSSSLTDLQVRSILAPHFPPPRISEILRVSHAPEGVYHRYTGGFFGFKSALKECRGYVVTGSEQLKRRKIRRAAERLVMLLNGPAQIRVRDRRIQVD